MTTILSYIFYFIAASASPLQRRWLATKKNLDNKGQIHFSFQVTLVTSVFSLLLLFFEPFKLSGNMYHLIGLTLICGVFGAGSYIFSYVAQKHVEAGITSLVSNIYTPITIILATIFLNEKLTLIQIFGTVLLLVGIVIVSKKHKIGRFKFDKYFLLMMASGASLAVLLVAERAMMKITGFTAGVMFSWWATCLCIGVIVLLTKNRSVYTKKDIAITGILRFLQNVSWVILVFTVGNLSLVSSVTTFKVVLMFIAGALILKERMIYQEKL